MPRLSPIVSGSVKIDEQFFAKYRGQANLRKFKMVHPLSVSGVAERPRDVSARGWCTTQMTVMLECLRDSDFSQVACAKQIREFDRCVAQHIDHRGRELTRTSTKMERAVDVEKMLLKYPVPKRPKLW